MIQGEFVIIDGEEYEPVFNVGVDIPQELLDLQKRYLLAEKFDKEPIAAEIARIHKRYYPNLEIGFAPHEQADLAAYFNTWFETKSKPGAIGKGSKSIKLNDREEDRVKAFSKWIYENRKFILDEEIKKTTANYFVLKYARSICKDVGTSYLSELLGHDRKFFSRIETKFNYSANELLNYDFIISKYKEP